MPGRPAALPLEASLGPLIKEMRRAAGMSQERLGERIGVSYQQFQKYENGTSRITVDRLNAIARELGVHVSAFLGNDSDKVPEGKNPDITPDELNLLRLYRSLKTQRLRRSVLKMIEDISKASRNR